MFRRRRSNDDEPEDLETELAADLEDDEATPEPAGPPPRPRGPWDEADAPEDEVNRVDLGGLRVPVDGTLELRVDVDPETQTVVSVTVATPTSIMQLAAFAAPKTAGIWTEVREEIAASLAGGGGGAEERPGPYGPELFAQVPTDVVGQQAPARFVGIDGPRWFLRAMLQGAAATDPGADPGLLGVFGQVVVCRGGDAMAVRDPLPLRLPEGIPSVEPPPAAPDISMLERGPEITETR